MLENSLENIVLQLALMGSGLLMLLFQWLSARRASPNLGILFRWMRWVFTALVATNVFALLGYDSHPAWVIAVAAFFGWFLIESGYTWLAIAALSQSDLPLFPRFENNPRGSEWPTSPDLIRLRNWFRQQGFRSAGNLLARFEDEVLMRLAVMETEDRQTRASVLFFPTVRGDATVALAFHSVAEDGVRIVTDNLFLPFGGFYPEHWLVERKPRARSIERLHQRHLARCDAYGKTLTPIETDPLLEVNQHNGEMERLNRQLGFLSPAEEQETEGRISAPGRARVWMEIWTLNYLGLARRYS